jgi:hypothetical protein
LIDNLTITHLLTSSATVSTCLSNYHKTPDSYINVSVDFGSEAEMKPIDRIGMNL